MAEIKILPDKVTIQPAHCFINVTKIVNLLFSLIYMHKFYINMLSVEVVALDIVIQSD